ncbi:TonB-dependent receptor, partial [Nostoc sp. UCD122]|nr:TonB-dependent receptor [Nostoc sp. UCD122]
MKKHFLLLTVALPGLLIAFPSFAAESEIEQRNTDKSTEVISDIQSLSEVELPATNAELLTQQSAPSEVNPETQPDYTDDADISIEAIA